MIKHIIVAIALSSTPAMAVQYFNFETQRWVGDTADHRIEKCTDIANELVRRDIRSGVIPVSSPSETSGIVNSFITEYVAVCMDRGWWKDVN